MQVISNVLLSALYIFVVWW